jgi:hypothetical protein
MRRSGVSALAGLLFVSVLLMVDGCVLETKMGGALPPTRTR